MLERSRVLLAMRGYWLLAAFAVIVIILLAMAWVDGGRESVHQIVAPVPIPTVPIPTVPIPTAPIAGASQ